MRAKPRSEKAAYLDRYRIDLYTLKRYERRAATHDVTEVLKRRKAEAEAEMLEIEQTINNVKDDKKRIVLQLYYIDLKSDQEIADALQISASAAARRRYTGLQLIEIPGEEGKANA